MSNETPDDSTSFAPTEAAPPIQQNLIPPEEEQSILRGFFSNLFAVCFSSTRFFESKPVHTRSLGSALTFGVTVEWIAAAITFLISLSMRRAIEESLAQLQSLISGSDFSAKGSQLIEMFRVNQMLFGIGAVILNPFLSIAAIYFTSLLLYFGVKTFQSGSSAKVSAEEFGFEGCVKLISYARGTSIFSFIPFIGGLVAPIWRACVIIIGVKHSFGVSTTRASFIAYFYATLITVVGMCSIIFLILSMWRLFSN